MPPAQAAGQGYKDGLHVVVFLALTAVIVVLLVVQNKKVDAKQLIAAGAA